MTERKPVDPVADANRALAFALAALVLLLGIAAGVAQRGGNESSANSKLSVRPLATITEPEGRSGAPHDTVHKTPAAGSTTTQREVVLGAACLAAFRDTKRAPAAPFPSLTFPTLPPPETTTVPTTEPPTTAPRTTVPPTTPSVTTGPPAPQPPKVTRPGTTVPNPPAKSPTPGAAPTPRAAPTTNAGSMLPFPSPPRSVRGASAASHACKP